MTVIEDRASGHRGAHHITPRDARDPRHRRSARRFRRRQLLRATATCSASSVALAALWVNRPPAPDWHSFTGPNTATWDVVGLVGSTLVVVTAAALAYLAAIAGANLIIGMATKAPRRSGRQAGRAVRLTRRAAPGWLAAAAVSIAAASASVPSAGAAEGPTDPATVKLEALTDDAVPASRGSARTMLPWATEARSRPSTAASTTSTIAAPTAPTAPTAAAPTVTAPAPPSPDGEAPGAHSVGPGEHFWAIAERIVAERGHQEPVEHYWSRLVEANRDRLVDRSDPSLLHVGQLIAIPD